MTEGKVKVLYIAGAGRSGSTLLDRVLGELDGFFSIGECRQVWDHGFLRDSSCGCGVRWTQCDVWKGILERAWGPGATPDPREMIRLRDRFSSATVFRRSRSESGRSTLRDGMGPYLDGLERLYRAIASETSSRVLVDSSKFSTYGVLLTLVPGIDLRVVHLVRDARANAFSWSRPKSYLEPVPCGVAVAGWLRSNLTAGLILRRRVRHSLRIRHEDVVRHPDRTVKQICLFVDEPAPEDGWPRDGVVQFGTNHTVGGNPDRFRGGGTRLSLDERWRTEMRARDRMLTWLLTWPLLLRYGYLGPRASS